MYLHSHKRNPQGIDVYESKDAFEHSESPTWECYADTPKTSTFFLHGLEGSAPITVTQLLHSIRRGEPIVTHAPLESMELVHIWHAHAERGYRVEATRLQGQQWDIAIESFTANGSHVHEQHELRDDDESTASLLSYTWSWIQRDIHEHD